jgi:ribosomal protein S18 acetylase RimI-like enzyme
MARLLVACQGGGGEPLGFVCGWLVAGEIQVMELAVHPQHHGRGLGRRLMEALLQACR